MLDAKEVVKHLREHLGLFILLLVALALRLWYCAQVGEVPLTSDPAAWHLRGLTLLETGAFNPGGDIAGFNASSYRPPLYPLFLAGVYKLFGATPAHAYFSQSVLGTLMLVALYWLGRLAFNKQTALIAVALCAFYPPMIGYCGVLLSEILFITLLLTALASTLWAFRGNACHWLPGILWGLTALCRPMGLLLCVISLVLAVLLKLENARLKKSLLIIGVALLTLSPWTIRNYVEYREFVLLDSSLGVNMVVGNNEFSRHGGHTRRFSELAYYQQALQEAPTIVAFDRALTQGVFTWIREHPLQYGKLVLKRAGQYIVADGEGWTSKYPWDKIPLLPLKMPYRVAFTVLAVVGLWTNRTKAYCWLLGLSGSYMLILSLSLLLVRYRHPIMPIIFLLGAFTACELVLRCIRPKKPDSHPLAPIP